MSDNHPIPLYLFAKAPVPGKVKTRMSPHLTPENCAGLAAQMLRHSLKKVCAHWPGKVVLTVAPNLVHPVFTELSQNYDFHTTLQVNGDLGVRLLAALREGIASAGAGVVMGCDVPQFDPAVLLEAHKALEYGKNIIGPAEDGGFYLLGLRQEKPELFDNISWGGGDVLRDLINNGNAHSVELDTLPTLRDIDEWSDLLWLSQQDGSYQSFVS